MRTTLAHPLVTLVIVAAVFWDAWRWYGARIAATPEEALALALTVLLVLVAGTRARNGPWRLHNVPLLPLAGFFAAYAAGHTIAQPFAPAIALAAIAVTAVLYALYRALAGERPPVAFYALAALSLPVLPSLQFVLGFPMRVVSASITVGLLNLQGVAVTREGTHLRWSGETIQFDAPCSGVNMLWAGMMLTLAACILWKSGWISTALALGASLLLTLIANVLRAVSLFYVEAELVTGVPAWGHEAIGLAAFALSSAVTIWMLNGLKAREPERWEPEQCKEERCKA
ncbi:MAG: archaeosortase/exosortase family protein [Hyphomicrobium sp.]